MEILGIKQYWNMEILSKNNILIWFCCLVIVLFDLLILKLFVVCGVVDELIIRKSEVFLVVML